MDLFNKKKIKKLEREISQLNNEIEKYQKNKRNWDMKIDKLEDISSRTMEENQKLIKWIMTTLDTVGVMEVREKRQVQIPVYIDKSIKAYNSNCMGIFEKERITIPEITIVKMG